MRTFTSEPCLSAAGNAEPAGCEPRIAEDALVLTSNLGEYVSIATDARIEESQLGDYSYVMERADIMCADIGKFVSIAAHARINPGNHPMDWVSQHHFLYRPTDYDLAESDDEDFFAWRKLQRVRVGHDVWIGYGAVIMPGVCLGNGSVVGAGSVVTRDVEPYTIVAGGPARKIRKRFPDDICAQLEGIAWWHWDHSTLKERRQEFRDLRKFLLRYGV